MSIYFFFSSVRLKWNERMMFREQTSLTRQTKSSRFLGNKVFFEDSYSDTPRLFVDPSNLSIKRFYSKNFFSTKRSFVTSLFPPPLPQKTYLWNTKSSRTKEEETDKWWRFCLTVTRFIARTLSRILESPFRYSRPFCGVFCEREKNLAAGGRRRESFWW